MNVRMPAVAGAFYPAERFELKQMIESFLESSKKTSVNGKLKGLIVPHAGYIYSGPVAGVGYRLLKENNPDAENVFLIGPSHSERFYGVAQATNEYWQTPFGKIEMEQLKENQIVKNYNNAHLKEHSLEVQLPFLQTVLKKFRVYALLTGDMSARLFAAELQKEIDDSSIIIASSDLSHYHSYSEAMRIDNTANKAIPSMDVYNVESFVEACGKEAILTLMQIAKIKKWKGKFLDYKNSGDTSGDKSRVVGYGCYAFYE